MPAALLDPDTRRKLRGLQRRIAAARVRMLGVRAATGAAAAAALLIGGVAAEAALDWLVVLPWIARACLTLPAAAGAAWLVWRDCLRPMLRLPGDYAMACEVERGMPVFQTRLIASIQLGNASATNALVGALIGETAAIAAANDFRQVVKTNRLRRALMILAAVAIPAGGFAWLSRDVLPILLQRALLMPVRFPARTRIAAVEAPRVIERGGDFKIAVRGEGVLPASGVVEAQSAAGMKNEYRLERDAPGSASYHTVIMNVQEPLSFQVELNDAKGEVRTLAVLDPPVVLRLEAEERFPAYTRLPPAPRQSSDLQLLAGSTLALKISASAPLAQATLHLAGPETDIPMRLAQDKRGAAAEFAIPAKGLAGFSIRLVDSDGLASREAPIYRIDTIPDRPPAVKLIRPDRETELVTAAGVERISFEAHDDFGIARVGLHYKVSGGKENTVEFDLRDAVTKDMAPSFDWQMGSLKVAPGAVIEYWIAAADANNVTGPGIGETGRQKLQIVTGEEKRAELLRRMNEELNGLGEVSRKQDELTTDFGSLIFSKPAQNPAP